MGNDKFVCDSPAHKEAAEVESDAHRDLVDRVMDEIGLPKEPVDMKKVACIPKEQNEDSLRPKLNASEKSKVEKNVAEFATAIKTNDLTQVGELFNRLAPRAENGAKPDEFLKRSGVKIADETFYQLNKELGKQGIEFDYRAMGVIFGDKSPSLIVSREHKIDDLNTEHLEVTLQGGTMKDFIKHSDAERVNIRDYGGPNAPPAEYIRQPVEGAGGKTSAETAFQEIMKPYFAAHK